MRLFMECYLDLDYDFSSISEFIKNFYKERNIICNVSDCSSLQELLNKKNIDILFVDMDKEIDCLNLCKQIIMSNPYVFLVMISKDEIKALDGYELGVNGFLLKPINLEKLEFYLKREEIRRKNIENNYIFIKNKDGGHFIHTEKIIFIEIKKHDLSINYLKNHKIENIHCRASLSQFENELDEKFFARCCIFALVNFKYISLVKNQKIFLSDGKIELPLSPKIKEDFMKRFDNYLSHTSINPYM